MLTESHTSSESAWAKIASGSFVDLEVHGTGKSFSASLRAAALEDALRISQVQNSASTVARTASGFRADANTDLLLLTPLEGQILIHRNGAHQPLRPGEYSVHFADEPYSLEYPDKGNSLVLQYPSQQISLPERAHIAPFSAGNAVGNVLRSLATEVLDSGDRLNYFELKALQDSAASLLSSFLLSATENQESLTGKQEFVLRVQSYLHAHFADPNLRAADVAAEFNVSLRYLQDALSEAGTSYSALLEQERVAEATRMLSHSNFESYALIDVAAACGYELNTFIRAFKRIQGETPAVFRRRVTRMSK